MPGALPLIKLISSVSYVDPSSKITEIRLWSFNLLLLERVADKK